MTDHEFRAGNVGLLRCVTRALLRSAPPENDQHRAATEKNPFLYRFSVNAVSKSSAALEA